MRNYTILLAAAPLALLAACGDGADDTAETAETAETDVAMDTAATPAADTSAMVDESGPATPIADAGDYSGTYDFAGEDGSTRSVRLDSSDKSYRYMANDGTEKRGQYTVTPDGYRLYLSDYYGSPGWFVYRNDAFDLVRNDIEVTEGSMITGERYARADAGDEVPSRRPELGSSVDRDQQ